MPVKKPTKKGSKPKKTEEGLELGKIDENKYGEQIISVSDIERYGYCPLNWWLKFKGLTVSNETLEKGTDEHHKIIHKVTKIKKHQKFSKTSEFNIKLFAFVAIMLAINAIVILSPNPIARDSLIHIAIIWVGLAVIYYFYNYLFGKSLKVQQSIKGITGRTDTVDTAHGTNPATTAKSMISQTSPRTWKRAAMWFIIIAGGLAFNGVAFLQTASTQLMSRIYMVSALVWLLGTVAILYFVLKREQKQDADKDKAPEREEQKLKYHLTESEKLIVGFALVATLLAINGITIQHRHTIANFTLVGLIIMILAALWLGVSFAFIYLSFRRSILARYLVKDFQEASTESKKFREVVEKIRTTPVVDHIFSYNWPLFFAVVVIVLGINSILIMYGTKIISEYTEIISRFLIIIALLWLLGSFIFLYDVLKNAQLADELRRLYGIYKGKIEYTDKMDEGSRMLFSKKLNIRGKPDYVVRIKGKFVPVEIKTGKIPKGPHFSHILQIAAYCMLINEHYQSRPPYGIITYGKSQKHKIVYDDKLENLLIEKIHDMRKCMETNAAHRNHHRMGKCRSCSRRHWCPEKLGD